MKTERRVVDNRVFLLGLDELYREAMKVHEREQLLQAARDTARTLSVAPADVPIEGYYAEDDQLKEYFCLIRALQQIPKYREPEVGSLDGYVRLKEVTQSLIFGPPYDGDCLLTVGKDSLSVALEKTYPEWSVSHVTNTAFNCALASHDYSLVALASLSRDPVALTALRESVVLYAMALGGAAFISEAEYVWEVDELLQTRAKRFVATFNDLFNECLPEPHSENAEAFWNASKEWSVVGRCVRIGFDDSVPPTKHYHWAIDHGSDYQLTVKEFWDTDIWTTERYRREQKPWMSGFSEG
jgi:hypothetical protein